MLNALNLTDSYKTSVIGLLIGFIVLSCSDVQKRSEPEQLVSKEKMVDIYTDMMLLDGMHRSSPKTLESYGIKVSEHLYNKYQIDSSTLAQNIEYYNFEFETNMEIYERVTERIENKKEKIDSITKLRDSLKKEERLKKIEKRKIKDSIEILNKKAEIKAIK